MIIAIYSNGNKVVEYEYNPWGNLISMIDTSNNNIGSINPIRYKGYYYDIESNLYYLKSRYYSPELCRFITPDSVDYLNQDSMVGINLYAYCGNDPVMYVDPSGHFSIGAVIGGAIIGIVVELFADFFEDDSFSLNHTFWIMLGQQLEVESLVVWEIPKNHC